MTIDTLNFGISSFTILVVLGVLLEGVEFIEDYKKHGWQLGGLKIFPKIGFLLLVIGLAGEWKFQSLAGQYEADRIVARSPRDLNNKQREAIAQTVAPFKGRAVEVSSNAADAEASRLVVEIINALKKSEINSTDARGNIMAFGPPHSSIEVTGPASESAFIASLRNALREQGGLTVDYPTYPERFMADGSPVAIKVGLKPITN